MDFEQLKGFYYTAKLRSFTKAAHKLYLTQPAVSLKVKALEKAVGEKLLERVGRKISLTPAGEVLYEQAECLVAKLDEIEQIVRDLKALDCGRLTLGASDTTSIYFLPELLRSYRETYPGVDLSIESVYSASVVQRVLDREIDLGFVSLPQSDSRLTSEPVFRQRFVCIVGHKHPFARAASVSVSELLSQPLILLGEGSSTRHRIDAYLARGRRKADVVMELSSYEIVKRYVEVGFGISIVPERVLGQSALAAKAGARKNGSPAPVSHPGLATIPLADALELVFGIVRRQDRPLSNSAETFLVMAREHFEES